MPPRGLGVVVPPSGSSRQVAAVRAHLRTEAFWTRRKRKSKKHVNVGEGSAEEEQSNGEASSSEPEDEIL
eukprot:scaffold553661_cov31-Prasinocladus_malaysianus.AAC.1